MLSRTFCLAACFITTGLLGGSARAAEATETTAPNPGLSHRISWQVSALSNNVWGTTAKGGPGATTQLGYDLFLTPVHAIGLVAGAGVDYSGYGADADAITWKELGARYTRLFAVTPHFAPFASTTLSVGRTGGELQRTNWMTTAGLDLGIEWLASRYVTFDGRLLDRFGRISGDHTGAWHNAMGFMLGMNIRFPG